MRDYKHRYSESDLPSLVHALNTIIFHSFWITNFCYHLLSESKTDERVVRQNLICVPNVWLYRKAANNAWIYSRI